MSLSGIQVDERSYAMVTAVLIVSHSIVCKVQQEFEDIGLGRNWSMENQPYRKPSSIIQSCEEKSKYQLFKLAQKLNKS